MNGVGWPDGDRLPGKKRRREGGLSSSQRRSMRARLLREKPFCVWCGRDLRKCATDDWQSYPANLPTIEHLKPLSQGGTNEYENLALACSGCNR